jgi:hypothetical protein
MNQPFPTEDDPKQPRAPWEKSPFGDDFDASKAYAEDDVYASEETKEADDAPIQPPKQDGEATFPWQSGSPNQKTTSSARLPWEMPDSPGQSYRTQTPPKTPINPPRPVAPKNVIQSKKLTSDLWQNINIPPWVLAAAATAAVLGVGVVWTTNIPKDSTTEADQNIAVGKNTTAGSGGGGSSSSASIPVRPMRPRVSPGSSSKDAAKPGYVPEATPSNPASPLSGNETTSSAETNAASPNKSPYLSSLEASSSEAGTEGPTDPFSPAYPPPKPPPEPKPTVAPPPKPQPLPPEPKVIPAVLSLEGVAVEGKTKLAIVRIGDQPLTAEVQVGATIEGWTVTAISDETVTLTKGKQRQVLRLP